MAIVRHEAVFLMLFSTVDYTHSLAQDKSQSEKSKHPSSFFHHPKPFFCYDTVTAAERLVKPSCCSVWLRGCGWQIFGYSVLSTVKLSRSEWPPLRCRLCGPGQDTGLQDCENCFTPHPYIFPGSWMYVQNTKDPFWNDFVHQPVF